MAKMFLGHHNHKEVEKELELLTTDSLHIGQRDQPSQSGLPCLNHDVAVTPMKWYTIFGVETLSYCHHPAQTISTPNPQPSLNAAAQRHSKQVEPNSAEPSRAIPSRAEQSRAEPCRAEQSTAGQSRAKQSRAQTSRAEQSRAKCRAAHALQVEGPNSHARPLRRGQMSGRAPRTCLSIFIFRRSRPCRCLKLLLIQLQ
jgi:hypothetical protein